jgi:hypothetical protein
VLGVLLLGVLVLELLLVLLMLFGAGGDVRVLFGEDTDNTGGDFLVNYSLVVFAYDVASEFLGGEVSIGLKR